MFKVLCCVSNEDKIEPKTDPESKEEKREFLRNNLPPMNMDDIGTFVMGEENLKAVSPQILDTEKVFTNHKQYQKRVTADWLNMQKNIERR